ncbi:hypothetical protein GCM10010232_20260 [Streptomyces amakusaensis]
MCPWGCGIGGSLRTPAHFCGVHAHKPTLGPAAARGTVFSHRDWIEANGRRELHRHGRRRLFAEFDAVVCPVSPTPAFPHDHAPDPLERRIDIDGVEYPYLDQLVWAGVATMPGLPATAVPAGRSPEGLPVGVQLIGPMFEGRAPLRLAELLEREIGGFRGPEQVRAPSAVPSTGRISSPDARNSREARLRADRLAGVAGRPLGPAALRGRRSEPGP